mmetsp:Transcript_2547/g.9777  ORF Transcript_2547/g.9777 Transcript_2547/m.9777 type:complete len:411 (+) Transcript_2547:307-1539(+)
MLRTELSIRIVRPKCTDVETCGQRPPAPIIRLAKAIGKNQCVAALKARPEAIAWDWKRLASLERLSKTLRGTAAATEAAAAKTATTPSQNAAEPTSAADDAQRRRRVLTARLGGALDETSELCRYEDRTVDRAEYDELVSKGVRSPIGELLGLRLRVVRHAETLRPGALRDNRPAVLLMGDPDTGLAPLAWSESGGLGVVDVVSLDGDFGAVDMALLNDFLEKRILSGFASDDGVPTGSLRRLWNATAFQTFVASRVARLDDDSVRAKNKPASVPFDSPTAAFVVLDRPASVHVTRPRVELVGLADAKYANATGYLGPWKPGPARYTVYVGPRTLGAKPENLRLRSSTDVALFRSTTAQRSRGGPDLGVVVVKGAADDAMDDDADMSPPVPHTTPAEAPEDDIDKLLAPY